MEMKKKEAEVMQCLCRGLFNEAAQRKSRVVRRKLYDSTVKRIEGSLIIVFYASDDGCYLLSACFYKPLINLYKILHLRTLLLSPIVISLFFQGAWQCC